MNISLIVPELFKQTDKHLDIESHKQTLLQTIPPW